MSLLEIDSNVNMAGLHWCMRPVLLAAERVYTALQAPLRITSALDGEHSPRSLHYYGLAIDLGVRNMTGSKRKRAVEMLQKDVGCAFQVIDGTNYIHVEWDPQ